MRCKITSHCIGYIPQTIKYCVLVIPCRLGEDIHSTSIDKMNFIKINLGADK